MKLCSDVLNEKNMDQTEISIQTTKGISVGFEYGLKLKPRPAIKPDGNSTVNLAIDQIKRFVYHLNDLIN